MKKKLVAILSFVVALILSVGIFSGCNLVTVNQEKDMEQVVATVNIGGDYKGETDEIYKKDLIIAYLNYGYYYVQNGQTTPSEMFKTILDNLTNNRVLLQTAKVEVKKADNLTISSWNAENFIANDDDKTDVKYQAIKSIDELIKQYISTTSTKQDGVNITARAIPTGATNAVEELSKEQKQAYVDKMMNKDKTATVEFKGKAGSDRLVAYNKAMKVLEQNEVLGNHTAGEIFTSYYFDYLLKNNYEAKIIERFETLLMTNKIDTTFNKLNYEALEGVFNDLYESQKDLYDNKDKDADYKTALSSATKTAPIIFAKGDNVDYTTTYGYVWNLLIGATEEQLDAIKKIDKKNKTEQAITQEIKDILEDNNRDDISSKIVIKDQRSSWITSGYDCVFIEDAENSATGTVRFINEYTFLGDYDFFANKGIPFQGKVEWVNKGNYTQKEETDTNGKIIVKYLDKDGKVDENYKPEYRIVSVDDIDVTDGTIDDKLFDEIVGQIIVPPVDGEDLNDVMKDVISELLFAFSTDPGSLNSFQGYLIKKGDTSSSWVKEFQKVGEDIIGKDKQQVATTEFGYHYMLDNGMVIDYKNNLNGYCQAVDKKVMNKACKKTGATASEYFEYLMNNWATLTDADKSTYLYSIASPYMANLISDYEKEIESKGVVKFESVYADLISD